MSKFLFVFVLMVSFAWPQWQTYYEQSRFLKTPRYPETIKFSQKLADNFSEITFTNFGESSQKRALPLLIIDKDGLSDPVKIRNKGRIIVLIEAGIHSGEIEGKDAGFIFFRDMFVKGKHKVWLENISFLFIPIFNVDGHERFTPYGRINQNGPEEMGWRVTAQNLNLNRDFLKTDTPEMQAWTRLYQKWLPEFFFDIHTTDGADFQYAITYAIEDKGNMAPAISQWIKMSYNEQLKEKMAARGFPTITYVFFRKRHQVNSGLLSWVASPRFSQGYTALMNRPGMLVETHMLKDYKTRVDATLGILKSTFEILNAEHKNLSEAIAESDKYVTNRKFLATPYALQWQMNGDSTMVDFLGFEYKTTHSDLSGGDWVQFSDKKKTFHIPYFDGQVPAITCKVPEAYLIPPQYQTVIKRLQNHGVQMYRLNKAMNLEIQSYHFSKVKFPQKPYEGHFYPSFEQSDLQEKRHLEQGTMIIPIEQIRAQLILQALEPRGNDSFLKWGFFNTIFERKEYAESYAIEKIARQMIEQDPDLKNRFEEKLKSDSLFASNPGLIRNWFYKQTPYWDQQYQKYPIAKIYEIEDLKLLLQSSDKFGK